MVCSRSLANPPDQMIEFSKGMSSMGLSMAETAKASTFIGSVLKQSGFAMERGH
jgi:hypothetical protein